MFLEELMRLHTHFIRRYIGKHQLKRLSHWLLPTSCILCGNNHTLTNICILCQKDLPILPQHCPQCAQFLPNSPDSNIIAPRCGSCLTQPPSFDHTFALFSYDPPVIQLITQLKFQQQLCYAKAFGELLSRKILDYWYADNPLPQLIIPVPLHTLRLRERGFNQALEIARPIARTTKICIDIHGVTRSKATLAQSGLSARERKHNIDNAFCVARDYSGMHIAVLDDVITTGNTIAELCKSLKLRGARRIDVWCCARTSGVVRIPSVNLPLPSSVT